MSQFDYSIEKNGNIIALTIKGDIKLSKTPDLQETVKEAFEDGTDYQEFIIDLKDVEYVDSSGIGFFIFTKRLSDAKEVKLTLKSPGADVMNVLKMTKLDDDFNIEN